MGLLADLYISTDNEAPLYDTSESFPEADRVESKSFTTLELSILWAILQGREWDVDMLDEFQCIVIENDGEQLIHRLPAGLVSQLAACDADRLSRATAQLAQTCSISL